MLTWFTAKKSSSSDRRLDAHALDITHVLARAGVPGFRQALPLLTSEFERARRYQHALSLVLFGADRFPGAAIGSGNDGAVPPGGHGLFPALLASVLRESTRETDVVSFAATLGRCVVLMPETARDQAEQAIRRLREVSVQRLLTPVTTGLAVFPSDGLVLDELIRFAAAQPQVIRDAVHALEEAAQARPGSALSSA